MAVITAATAIGPTPGNIRYEMNSGGQSNFDGMMLHLAQVGAYADPSLSMMEGFRFRDDPKPIDIQFGKSRGNGDPNTPGFHKRTAQYDRLFRFSTYGSSDFSFSHANYWLVMADYDSLNNNEQPAYQHIYSSNALSNGNGVEINSLAQVAIPGPNRLPHGAGVNFGGVCKTGPGSATMPQEALDSGPLTMTPAVGTRSYNGRFWGVDISGRHKQFAMVEPLALTLVQVIGTGVATMRSGLDWAEITLVMTGAEASVGTIARVNIAPPADGSPAPVPAVLGSMTFSGASSINQPVFIYTAKATNFTIANTGQYPLEAGVTYKFTLLWRLP